MQDNDDDIKDNDNKCNSGNQAEDKGCNSLQKRMEGKKQLPSCIERINNYAPCNIPKIPKASNLGSYGPYVQNNTVFDINYYPPISDLHPSGILIPPSGGRSPVYSADGKVIGYREIYYKADVSTANWKPDPIDFVLNLGSVASLLTAKKVIGKVVGGALCPECDAAMTITGALRFLDQSIVMDGQAANGPMVPIHDVSFDLEPMMNPLDPYIRPK